MLRAVHKGIKHSQVYSKHLSVVLRRSTNDSKPPKSTSDVSDLLKSLDQPIDEPQEVLQNLIKKQSVKRKEKTIKVAKELSARRHKEGEQFLFKRTSSPKVSVETVNVVKNIGHTTEKLQFLDNKPKDPLVKVADTQPFKLSDLKSEIDESLDGRSITKLMSALINEVDKDSPNPEEKLKALMKEMGKQKTFDHDLTEEHASKYDQLKDKRRRYQPFSLSRGDTTDLFTDILSSTPQNNKSTTSLHEKQWLVDLHNLLPENLPQNSFEVMMLDIDRQWEFPIDNEQDMGIEEQTSFEEHVFLDHHLDEFPEEGPVRKFMELVVTGLQQNPHLTIEQKVNRIVWFRDYFDKFPAEDLAL